MHKHIKIIVIFFTLGILTGCVPPQPKVNTSHSNNSASFTSTKFSAYGKKPRHYVTSIKNYFSNKLLRASHAKYIFTTPMKAYKQKAYTYGGEVEWKGWMVKTSIATPTRTGRMLSAKPYMVLFNGEQIVESIVGNRHRLITEVGR